MNREAREAPTTDSATRRMGTQRRSVDSADSEARRSLIEATRACIRDQGISGATSRSITAAAGVNLGAITYYFGSKDALIAETLFGELAARLAPVADILTDDNTSAANRLASAVGVLLVEFERAADELPVYLDAVMSATREGLAGERARTMLLDLTATLTDVIGQLRDDGTVAAWVDPTAMASLLISTANGIALQSQLDPNGPPTSALTNQLVRLLLAAQPAQEP